MSLKSNIVEKLYDLLNSTEISMESVNNSELVLLHRHFNDLTIEKLIFELEPEDIDKIKSGLAESKVSEQKYILNLIIGFLLDNLKELSTKERRLEFYLSLPHIFKSIYKSLFYVLAQ